MSYQMERDRFISQMTREGLSFDTTLVLLRAASTIQRYAEMACSSEAADRDRVPCPASTSKRAACLCDGTEGQHEKITRITLQEARLVARLEAAIATSPGWILNTQGDPRGYCLRVIPPSYAKRNEGQDRFNRSTIGVPARESRIRW